MWRTSTFLDDLQVSTAMLYAYAFSDVYCNSNGTPVGETPPLLTTASRTGSVERLA